MAWLLLVVLGVALLAIGVGVPLCAAAGLGWLGALTTVVGLLFTVEGR